mmetsp:Transcript_35898/g.32300  ORF Transcript_35898/g.32300 Transcript_35898/m.32300 type:complete len:90 (-) Transcript_35898:115-384(-)
MREAVELGWAASYIHAEGKSFPEFVHIDDVQFINPVEIGSIATFESFVTYTEDNLSNVVITVDTTKGDRRDKVRTCEVHITLAHTDTLR